MKTQWVVGAVTLAVALALGTVAAAGERAERVQFMDRLFSVAIPAGWEYEFDYGAGLLTVKDGGNENSGLLILAPNPALEKEDAATFAGMFLGVLVKGEGDLKVQDEEWKEFKGQDSVNASFNLWSGDGNVLMMGIINAVMFRGGTVIMIALASEAEAEDFLPTAVAVMKSYEINAVRAKSMEKDLAETGRRIIEEVMEALEEDDSHLFYDAGPVQSDAAPVYDDSVKPDTAPVRSDAASELDAAPMRSDASPGLQF